MFHHCSTKLAHNTDRFFNTSTFGLRQEAARLGVRLSTVLQFHEDYGADEILICDKATGSPVSVPAWEAEIRIWVKGDAKRYMN